ncbi:MAG: phosphopyruvate hydratase [Mycoplasmoidaceae bacterium]
MIVKIIIKNINAYEVLDSRGLPTVACDVTVTHLFKKFTAKAMVPSGASTGEKEAVELRDGDKIRYNGKGVLKAVKNINTEIKNALKEKDALLQSEIDQIMIDLDGTQNKSRLGANAILAVSLATAKAAAGILEKPLYRYIAENLMGRKENDKFIIPVPMLNVINGGAHADGTIDFQEFMFMPVGAKSIKSAVQIASECFYALQKILKNNGYNTNKGDEGGFAPTLKNADEAFEYMIQAIKDAGYSAGIDKDVVIAIDPAASEFYDKETKTYKLKKAIKAGIISEQEGTFSTEKMIELWSKYIEKYPIISIEDGLDENDWNGFAKMVELLGSKIQIVGDDLYCTNPKLAAEGVEKKLSNSILIKLNQIGTLTETINAVNIAHNAGWTAVVSHRSGETEDTTIADLAVGLGVGQIKTGSMSRSERIAKYNRLIEIENELDSNSIYKGLEAFKNLK